MIHQSLFAQGMVLVTFKKEGMALVRFSYSTKELGPNHYSIFYYWCYSDFLSAVLVEQFTLVPMRSRDGCSTQ